MDYVLDIETSSISGNLADGYALEPWRLRLGQAYISSIGLMDDQGNFEEIIKPSKEQIVTLLRKLKDKRVWAHNAIFDVSWLIAAIEPNKLAHINAFIREVQWMDSQLLGKWVINGRKADDSKVSYSLINLCKLFFKDEPGLNEFIAIKQGVNLDSQSEYWQIRNKLDCVWTMKLVKFLKGKLPQSSINGFKIEQQAIPQLANSWLIGMYINQQELQNAEIYYHQVIKEGCEVLNLPQSVISSPDQLGNVLFNQWGFTPVSLTPGGKASTKADDILVLAYSSGDPRLKKIIEVKQAITLISKYIETTKEALSRTGDGYIYPIPRMFGTTSGRLTYASETIGYKVSIAAHQIPRKDKLVRKFICPPPGIKLWEADANSQESRIMGIWSKDAEIIRIFNNKINFHTNTASKIYGIPYQTLQDRVNHEDLDAIEYRQFGKLTNLSCNFRIGGKSLARKALTEYDKYLSEEDGRRLVNVFKRTYPDVKTYWNSIINFTRDNGYAYTLAGRRYKVSADYFGNDDSWKAEGTIISHPIQGTAGEMYYAAISQVPYARIQMNLHDGVFFLVDDKEESDYILQRMNETPYQELWDLADPLPINLIYDGSKLADNYAGVK